MRLAEDGSAICLSRSSMNSILLLSLGQGQADRFLALRREDGLTSIDHTLGAMNWFGKA